MPNNPTYQPIYQALQDYIPDTEQREQALQLLQEVAIVMFSEAGDLQSNVQSTDAEIIFTPYQQANQQLLQTMACYIEESQKHIGPFVGGGGDGEGDDNIDGGWHLNSEDEADSYPDFKANLKKSLAEQIERHLLRQQHYKTWRCYTITLEFFITFLTMQRSKLREIHVTLRNECRTKSQILARLQRNQQSNEISFQLLIPPVTHTYSSYSFYAVGSLVV
jgi:hypothetical protein